MRSHARPLFEKGRRLLVAAAPVIAVALRRASEATTVTRLAPGGGYTPADATNAEADGTPVDLESLNGSGVTARSLVVKGDETVTISLAAEGFDPGRQHRLNIHRNAGERAVGCVTDADDGNGDGEVDLDEGGAARGPIVLELLPTPTAGDDGTATFEGTFPLEASKIYSGVIVVSGASVDGAFDPSVPVACGQLGI